jgi:proline dehydrogenase
VAHAYGEPTDLAYLALAERLPHSGAEAFIATHDGLLREACRKVLPGATIEMLLGVRTDVALSLAADPATAVRIYTPYGPGWFRYGMRRLAESRGA